jgi:hypothetical protein
VLGLRQTKEFGIKSEIKEAMEIEALRELSEEELID